MYGPTGIGILYGKQALLETLRPVTFGGGMVVDACADPAEYKESPLSVLKPAHQISLGSSVSVPPSRFSKNIGFETIPYTKNLLTMTLTRLREKFR